MKQFFNPVLFIALAMYCSFSWAQDQAEADGVIRISADETYYNSKDLFSRYQGNVTLSQDNFSVFADRLEISESDKLAYIHGMPLLIQFTSDTEGPSTITADQAVLNFNEKTFQLSGSVNLNQGAFSIMADKIFFNIETGELHATQNSEGDGQQNRTVLVADSLL